MWQEWQMYAIGLLLIYSSMAARSATHVIDLQRSETGRQNLASGPTGSNQWFQIFIPGNIARPSFHPTRGFNP